MFSKGTIPLVAQEMHPWCIHKALVGLQQTNIKNLLIQSDGGSSVSLIWAIDHLSNANLCTIGGSTVGSLAVTIFLCGTRRVAFSDTRFFIHRAGFMCNGERVTSSFAQMKSLVCREVGDYDKFTFWQTQYRLLGMLDKKIIKIIVDKTQISTDVAAQFLIQEKTFSAQEAKECGIVHEIISPMQVDILSEHGIYEPWSK
jgi:ATP-dependent protease ClpP protease subunit